MISASWGTRDVGRTLGEPMLPAPPRCYCISLSICSLVLQPAWLAWDRVGTYTSRVGAVALVAVGAFADNTGIDVLGGVCADVALASAAVRDDWFVFAHGGMVVV